VTKDADSQELWLSKDELRELHLALALRIAHLGKTDTRKMMPSEKDKVKRRIDICTDLDKLVQKLRGK
jgi:hypothetical protein